MESVKKHAPLAINIGLVVGGIALDRWARSNWASLKISQSVSKLAPLTLIDATVLWGGWRLLNSAVRQIAAGGGSWEDVLKSCKGLPKRVYAPDSDHVRISPTLDAPPAVLREFAYALYDPPQAPKKFLLGNYTPNGLVYGRGGSVEVRRNTYDIWMSISNDGKEGWGLAHEAFFGYLTTVRETDKELNGSPAVMVSQAVQCAWAHTRTRIRLAVANNYIGAVMRPLTVKQREHTDYTHQLAVSGVGRTALFVMEERWYPDDWFSWRRMVAIADENSIIDATYWLKPGDIVCLASGYLVDWIAEGAKPDTAFALFLTETKPVTAESVRNALCRNWPESPVIIFQVPVE